MKPWVITWIVQSEMCTDVFEIINMYADQVCQTRSGQVSRSQGPSHCRREGKNRVLIFLTAPGPWVFPGARVPTFNSINFREKRGKKTIQGLMGNGGGAGNDGFIFTPEWKPDAFTHKRRWVHTFIAVFSFRVCGGPFSSHMCECRIEKGMFVWAISLPTNTGQPPGLRFPHLLLWQCSMLPGTKAPSCCWPTGKTNSLLTEIPQWRIKSG